MLCFHMILFLFTLCLMRSSNAQEASLEPINQPIVPCRSPLTCTPLKDCKPLMTAIKASQNSQTLLKFLKSQICGDYNQQERKVCCPDDILDHKSIKKQLNESPCKSSFECLDLPKCGPLMYLLGLEKPLTAGIVKFIRSRQCGAGTIYPKVCCKVPDGGKITSVAATTEGVFSSSTMSMEEKSEALNKFFNSDYFDLMMFDFFVRRKK